MTGDMLTERARAIAAIPDFARPIWWLTFYITGDRANLDGMSDRLAARGAVNLCGAEEGFTYPKLEISSDPVAVAQAVAEVQQLAVTTGVVVLSVDVDTSSDVQRSTFKELMRFD